MGVKACNRNGCDAVMCDRYSSDHGYICDECFDDLVSVGVGVFVADFMNTPRNNSATVEATRVYFGYIFEDQL